MAYTFDDGILKIYAVENTAEPGNKPKEGLVYKSSYYFGFEKVGITRYYTAMQNHVKVDEVVHIYQDRSVYANDVVIFEDDLQHWITQVQHTKDDDGIDISVLSLQRLGEDYAIK